MIWLVISLTLTVAVVLLTAGALWVSRGRREPPRVAVLESREPRDAVREAMRRR